MSDFKAITCFKAYDARGKVPEELNADIAYRIGRAFVDFLSPKHVVVGRDIRQTGPEIQEALVKGLTEGGADVTDIGICGTEMVYFATSFLQADGGIMITASHNPPEYNGMKFVRENSKPISGDTGLKQIEKIAANGKFKQSGQGSVKQADVMQPYIEKLLTYIDVKKLKPLKVVVNAGNGCAGPIIDELEKHLPLEFIKVHHEPDGSFPNGVPNPLILENRAQTADIVKKEKAAIGIAWDGDFDRCFFFDENGDFIEGYYIVGFLGDALLEKDPNSKIVYDPRLTWNTIEVVKASGGIPIMSKSGHAFIKEKMRQEDAIYGGEMSAHHYFKEFYFCDSGMVPWLLVLEIMCERDKSMAQMVEERIKKYPVSGEINSRVKNADATIEKIKKHFQAQKPEIITVDGISMEFSTWRFNIRKSNTEPILRLNVESKGNATLLDEKTKEILDIIQTMKS